MHPTNFSLLVQNNDGTTGELKSVREIRILQYSVFLQMFMLLQ